MKNWVLMTTLLVLGFCLPAKSLYAQIVIDKGVIVGDFTIQFNDMKLQIKPGEEFSLAKLGLAANNFKAAFSPKDDPFLDPPVELSSDKQDIYAKRFWKQNKYYQIVIHNNKTNKDYDGVVVFFNCYKDQKNESVCQSYEINIDDVQFEQADNGHVTTSYEYLKYDNGNFNPTWLIFFKKK